MPIKLIRTDFLDCTKIPIQLGEHIIGRGKLLDCNDKRISREHGKLLVKDDFIIIKALHQNPCFYIKKGSKEKEILRVGNSITLNNGDRFGLLPDTYWYEVLFCLDENSEDNETDKNTEEYPVAENCTDRNTLNSNKANDDSKIINFNYDETLNKDGPESPSLINNHDETNRPQNDLIDPQPTINESEVVQQEVNEPVSTQPEDNEPVRTQPEVNEPVRTQPKVNEPVGTQSEVNEHVIRQPNENKPDIADLKSKEPASSSAAQTESNELKSEEGRSNNTSPLKRSHSSDSNDVKKIKLEDDKVKPDPDGAKAGPSDQGAAANVNNGSPNNRPIGARERCIYGAVCYRKNHQHRAQYSHPDDADWGPGERGICPYGMNCYKRDLRHWRDHEHPPGVLPPPGPGQKKRQKKRDVLPGQNIVAGKRDRKTVQRQDWLDVSSDQESDPFGTDESDEWEPDSNDYSEDYV